MSSALCGDSYRAYIDPFGWLPPADYRAGWLYDGGGRFAHYFPAGTAHSACWRWERPDLWPPVSVDIIEPSCKRCRERWRRDQQRGRRG